MPRPPVRSLSLVGAFLVLLGSGNARAQEAGPESVAAVAQESALQARVDGIAQRALRTGRLAGFSIAVSQGDEMLVEGGWGHAHIELEVPATAGTVYRIGSITKQFTAAAIMRQVELGRIDLDASMTEYLPDFDTQEHDVGMRHLLRHTSGIKSYTGLPSFWQNASAHLSHEELVDTFEALPFDFAPGEEFRYNNSGYYLLGMIVEKVGGARYEDVLRQEFFEPLEMTRTCYGWNQPIIKGRASGYSLEEGKLVNCKHMSMSAPGGAGALCSTVGDLVRWNRGLAERTVVDEDSYEQMTTAGTLNNGDAHSYGFGLMIGELPDGRPLISHGGGIFGFSSHLLCVPDEDLSIAVLTNTGGADPGAISRQILRAVLSSPGKTP